MCIGCLDYNTIPVFMNNLIIHYLLTNSFCIHLWFKVVSRYFRRGYHRPCLSLKLLFNSTIKKECHMCIFFSLCENKQTSDHFVTFTSATITDSVAQSVDSTIHWKTHYALNNSKGFSSAYPHKSDLVAGWHYQMFEQLVPRQIARHF